MTEVGGDEVQCSHTHTHSGGHAHPHAQEHLLIYVWTTMKAVKCPAMTLFFLPLSSFACDFSNTVNVVKALSVATLVNEFTCSVQRAMGRQHLGRRRRRFQRVKERWIRIWRIVFHALVSS